MSTSESTSATTTAAAAPTMIGKYTKSAMTAEAFEAMRASTLEASELPQEVMGEGFVGCIGLTAFYE